MRYGKIRLFGIDMSRVSVLLVSIAVPTLVGGQEVSTQSNNSPNSDTSNQTEGVKLKDHFKFVFELGAQIIDTSGERPTKFEQYQRIRKGLTFRRFRIASNPANSPDFFRAIGRSVTESDQQYFIEAGRYGYFRTTFEFDGFRHLISEGARTLYIGGNREIRIDDNIRTTLQNTANDDLPAVIQSIYATAPEIRMQTRRDKWNFTQSVNLTDNWSVRFNWNRYRRYGSRPMGIGSYERVGTPVGDTFRVHSTEIPEQLDYLSDQLTFGTRYTQRNWGISFDYIYSKFSNEIPTLAFDNPFRITDLQATGPGGPFDRQKYARGIISLPPSNSAQTIMLSAFIDLPMNTRAAGAWSWSFWRQNEAFAPYTLNSAIVTGVPAGLDITSPSSLPTSDLDGAVDIFTQDYIIASQPWKHWTFNLHFRRYENDNKTLSIRFPGYAAYGEAFWRSNIAGVPIENEAQSFFRTNTSAEAIWDISKAFRWKFEYEWEGWVRQHRQAGRTNEHTLTAQLTFKPTTKFRSRLRYKHSDREPVRYDPGVKEFSELRMYDQAKRIRHNIDIQWEYSARPDVGVSGTFGYLSDDYDENFFGLLRYSQLHGSVDLLYMPDDNLTFYANYSREGYKNTMHTVAKTANPPYSLENRWNRDERDLLDNFGIGMTTYAIKEKLFLDLNYVFSNANVRTTTVNPDVPLPNAVLNAVPTPFPDVRSRLQEFNSDISYQFGEKWGLGVRYKYQPYNLNDFAVNNLSPYPFNDLPAEQDGHRFLLLDSRYSSHTAHLLTVYVRFNR